MSTRLLINQASNQSVSKSVGLAYLTCQKLAGSHLILVITSDVNEDLTFKDKDKDQTLKTNQGPGQGPDTQGQGPGQGLGQLWAMWHRPHGFIFALRKCQPSLDCK